MNCERCGGSIIKDYDYAEHIEYLRCLSCGTPHGIPTKEESKDIKTEKELKDNMRTLPEDVVKRIEELTLKGLSNGEIVIETGVNARTVGRYVKEYYSKTGEEKPIVKLGKKKALRVDIKYGEEGKAEREAIKPLEDLIRTYQVTINIYKEKVLTLQSTIVKLKSLQYITNKEE